MTPPLDKAIDRLIRRAIADKRLLRFSLDGHARIAEPHDFGIRNAAPQLLAYQISGGSRSGRLPDWRWVDLTRASGFEMLDQTFPGSRAAPSGKHARWDRLFARVDQSVEPGEPARPSGHGDDGGAPR